VILRAGVTELVTSRDCPCNGQLFEFAPPRIRLLPDNRQEPLLYARPIISVAEHPSTRHYALYNWARLALAMKPSNVTISTASACFK
jgi:hypothetical protein